MFKASIITDDSTIDLGSEFDTEFEAWNSILDRLTADYNAILASDDTEVAALEANDKAYDKLLDSNLQATVGEQVIDGTTYKVESVAAAIPAASFSA